MESSHSMRYEEKGAVWLVGTKRPKEKARGK